MKNIKLIAITLVAAATLAACGGMPKGNVQLDQARTDYRNLQADPRAQNSAGGDVKLASEAMSRANAAWNADEPVERVNHLSYLASQRVAIARAAMDTKSAEAMVASAAVERTKVQLGARTQEADAAQRSAAAALQTAQMAQIDAANAQRSAEAARGAAAASDRQTQEALERNRALEMRLKELNAKATPRGLVITLGDVLFDVDRSTLQAEGLRLVDQLAAVLKEYPQRNALVEGFTDSTGSDGYNQTLSGQRADAVRTALMRQGIAMERVSARGYGETSPVGSNATAAGRQLNRRVEIVLSDDNGKLIAR
jgi:outer membrane protein OmpA-like peptidoglycan-associated protein